MATILIDNEWVAKNWGRGLKVDYMKAKHKRRECIFRLFLFRTNLDSFDRIMFSNFEHARLMFDHDIELENTEITYIPSYTKR